MWARRVREIFAWFAIYQVISKLNALEYRERFADVVLSLMSFHVLFYPFMYYFFRCFETPATLSTRSTAYNSSQVGEAFAPPVKFGSGLSVDKLDLPVLSQTFISSDR